MVEYIGLRLLSLVAPLLSSGMAALLCNLAGDAAWLLMRQRRGNVARNLSMVLGSPIGALDPQARDVFRQGTRYYYDTFRAPALADEEIEGLVTLQGEEHLGRALAEGKGIILVTAHLGSPSMVAQILRVKGYAVTAVVEQVHPQRLLDLMTKVRGSRGINVIPLGSDIVRRLSEALKRNEVVGMLVDRDVAGTGAKVSFFGAPTTLPTGPVMLALRTGAALVPAFAYRLDGGRVLGVIGETIPLQRSGNLREDIKENAQRVAGVVEEAIARQPTQWILFEPVWSEADVGKGQGRVS